MSLNNYNDKRPRILVAATEIFARLPYHQVKIEDIAAQAGVGKGTIYEYFSSKDDLFVSLMKLSAQVYFAEMAKAAGRSSSAKEQLQNILYYHLNFIGKNADMANILIGENRLPRVECTHLVREQREQLQQIVSGLLVKGIENEEFRALDPGVAAYGIMGTLAALWGQVFFEEKPIEDPQKLTEQILDFFLYGLAQNPGL